MNAQELIKKRPIQLSICSMICMLAGFVGVIVNVPLYTYILASFGMIFIILAWIIAKRERDAIRKRLVFAPITPSATGLEWMEWSHQTARDIATHFDMPPQLLDAHRAFKMPEEWDTFAEELRKR